MPVNGFRTTPTAVSDSGDCFVIFAIIHSMPWCVSPRTNDSTIKIPVRWRHYYFDNKGSIVLHLKDYCNALNFSDALVRVSTHQHQQMKIPVRWRHYYFDNKESIVLHLKDYCNTLNFSDALVRVSNINNENSGALETLLF